MKNKIRKNFEFDESFETKLKEITKAVDKISTVSFSDTKTIQALIFIGSSTSPEKIYEAYKKSL